MLAQASLRFTGGAGERLFASERLADHLPVMFPGEGDFIHTSFSLKVFSYLCYANRAYRKDRGKRARPLVGGTKL